VSAAEARKWTIGKPVKSFLSGMDMYRISGPEIVNDWEDWGFTKEDATIMAAAPDMLAALQKIVECEKNRAGDLRHREAWSLVKFSEDRIAAAEAAIAKATGAKE
jgi:hypothetical protein